MICKLDLKEYLRFKDFMRQKCGIASLEWIRLIDEDTEKVEIYIDEELGGFMILHRGVNVFIKTSLKKVLKAFLDILKKQKKEYAFRCSEWMSTCVLDVFKPQKKNYTGVILLTYYVKKDIFRRYVNPNYVVTPLSQDSAKEILEHTRRPFPIEFIRDRIRKGYFYGIYDNQKLVSHIGTLWESGEACEIGFAYTTEKYRCKGLAKTLASIVTERVLKEGKIPILHTVETNVPAIKVCESLGYQKGAREWAYYYTPIL